MLLYIKQWAHLKMLNGHFFFLISYLRAILLQSYCRIHSWLDFHAVSLIFTTYIVIQWVEFTFLLLYISEIVSWSVCVVSVLSWWYLAQRRNLSSKIVHVFTAVEHSRIRTVLLQKYKQLWKDWSSTAKKQCEALTKCKNWNICLIPTTGDQVKSCLENLSR